MTETPLISVIIPIYNSAEWLGRCLDSVLEQGVPRLEAILADDASSDFSPEICRDYCSRFPDVFRYLRLPGRVSTGETRNAGLEEARGSFVSFLDSDDALAPGMLSTMLAEAERSGAGLALCGLRVISENGEEDLLPPPGLTAETLLENRRFQPSACNKLFRRSIVEKYGIRFAPSLCAEDMAFSAKFLCTGPKLAVVPRPLYLYYRRGGSVTFNLEHRAGSLTALKDLKEFLRANGLWEAKRGLFRRLFWLHAVYHPLAGLLIDSLWKGYNRSGNLRRVPGYIRALGRYFAR